MNDRLTLIEARYDEQGRPDGDKEWLIQEVKRLREQQADYEKGARALCSRLSARLRKGPQAAVAFIVEDETEKLLKK